MTDDDNSNLVDMDDLNTFENTFFEREAPKEDIVENAEVDENENDQLAPDEDEDAETEDDESPEEEDEGEEEEVEEAQEEKPKPKSKNRKSAKERIEELVAEARVAQRERDVERREREALQQKLVALEKVEVKEAPTLQEQLPPEAPKPNAVNAKGEPLYPLGEFDPAFITDLTRFTAEREFKVLEERKAKEVAEQQKIAYQKQLNEQWNEKVEKIEEELPDFRQNVSKLGQSLQNIEPNYGEFLANTIMECDNGPEIIYYLSQNIGEAQKIVASGPFAATLAIGRLQAKLEQPAKKEPTQPEKRDKKVSEAPPPPEMKVRGKGGQFTTRSDTDDLDAFEREFFKKPGRR